MDKKPRCGKIILPHRGLIMGKLSLFARVDAGIDPYRQTKISRKGEGHMLCVGERRSGFVCVAPHLRASAGVGCPTATYPHPRGRMHCRIPLFFGCSTHPLLPALSCPTKTLTALRRAVVADMFIMSVDGIDINKGISTFYYQESEICKCMMERAAEPSWRQTTAR